MKQQNYYKIQLALQIISSLTLLTTISMSVVLIAKTRLPEISDREIIFWLTEFD